MADHTLINRLTVSIDSLRIQLNRSEDLNEIQSICDTIIKLESEIYEERKKEVQTLSNEKEDIKNMIASKETLLDDITREISELQVKKDLVLTEMTQLEESLEKSTKKINDHLLRYRKKVISRMMTLESEVNERQSEITMGHIE